MSSPVKKTKKVKKDQKAKGATAAQEYNLMAVEANTPSQHRFHDVEEGSNFDLCILRLTSQMQPCEYSVKADGKLKIQQVGSPKDFYGMVRFDERTGDSKFVPNTGNAFPHYCEFLLEEGGKIDGCAKVGVGGTKTGAAQDRYFMPLWTVVPKAAGQSAWFRENATYLVSIEELEDNDYEEYQIFKARKVDPEEKKPDELIGRIDGLNQMNLDGYYLIPLILPEKLVVFYATKDEAKMQDWHSKLNDYADNANKTLMVGINTPLFRDDEMCVFITFDADLKWYENRPPNS